MKNTNDPFAQLFGQLKTHAKLVGAGVDNRSALEMSFGKETADESYKILAIIANEENQPNLKNN